MKSQIAFRYGSVIVIGLKCHWHCYYGPDTSHACSAAVHWWGFWRVCVVSLSIQCGFSTMDSSLWNHCSIFNPPWMQAVYNWDHLFVVFYMKYTKQHLIQHNFNSNNLIKKETNQFKKKTSLRLSAVSWIISWKPICLEDPSVRSESCNRCVHLQIEKAALNCLISEQSLA